MDRIHMPTLRVSVCGYDKIPKSFSMGATWFSLYNSRGDFLGKGLVRVNISSPPKFGKRSSSKHRVFVLLGNYWVPAGRLTQCRAFKNGARFN